MGNNTYFETERLFLKPTTIEDASFIYELLNTPKWLQYIGDRNVASIKSAEKYIQENILPYFKKNGFSNYTVIKKEGLEKIGSCGLYDRKGLEGIDIGYAFLPQYEGKGYAFEAANKIKEVAFSVFKIPTLLAITSQKNLGSQKLLQKLDFKYDRLIKIPNDDDELMLYQFHAEE
jgi:RimJ/RimL family protein N-acetyltransferase